MILERRSRAAAVAGLLSSPACSGSSLLRRCREFRRRFVDLQPHVIPEVDWQVFCDYFKPDVGLEIFHDRDSGALRAMYAWSLRRPRIDGRTRNVLDADPRWQDGQGLAYLVRLEPLYMLRRLLLR